MDFVLRQRQPSEGYTHVVWGKFLESPVETHCFLAAASCSVHLFGIETLGAEELIVPVASLDLFGHITQIACLPQVGVCDLALVLLKTGELKILICKHGRLRVVDSISVLHDLVEDFALFLAVHANGVVAVGSRFGRIGLLHFSDNHNTATSFRHASPKCIDLAQEKDNEGKPIMPDGNERLVSLDLSDLPPGWHCPEKFSTNRENLENFQVTLWVGFENARSNNYEITITQGCTRVAVVSLTPHSPTATLPSSDVHWYNGNLPNRSTPIPTLEYEAASQDPAFFSFVESRFPESMKQYDDDLRQRFLYCYSTAAKCRKQDIKNSVEHAFKVYFDDLRPLEVCSWRKDGAETETNCAWVGRVETISSWYWELESELEHADKSNNEGYCLVIATTAGRIYRVSMAHLRKENQNHLEEEGRVANCLDIPDNEGNLGFSRINDSGRVSLYSCGSVEGGIVAMTPLPGGRLVCITDEHAVVLLKKGEKTVPYHPASHHDAVVLRSPLQHYINPTCSYSFVHCYQGAGSLVSCAKFHSNGDVTAVRGGSFERLFEYSDILEPMQMYKRLENQQMDVDKTQEKALSEPMETAVGAAAMENEGAEQNDGSREDISVGGANAYGARGALVTIHKDTLLEKMFEGKAGDVLGVTGLWPLKKCPADTHHAAVLLASTGSARVLAVVGGGVFSDVTDSLQIGPDEETLAAGNLEVEDWVAQVTPRGLRAFRLDETSTASLDWHLPNGMSITNGTVSNGIVVIQTLCNSQHSLVALKFEVDGAELKFVQVGEPFSLPDEASCIGNIVMGANNTHAIVIVGTYGPSILILELSLLNWREKKSELPSWCLLGETHLDSQTKNQTRLQTVRLDLHADTMQGVEWNRSSAEWAASWPGSPLGAVVRDQWKPHALQHTTGASLPSSIAVSVADGGDYKVNRLELWVSSRSGAVHCLQFPNLMVVQGKLDCAVSRSLFYAELPPFLALLPQLKRVNPNFQVLAVSGRASLLRASLNFGATDELRLHTPGVSCAIPLILDVPDGGDRLFLLSVSEEGTLSLSSLEAHQRSKIIARPLPWRPDVVASDEKNVPGVVAIAGRRWFHYNALSTEKMVLTHVELWDSAGQRLNDFPDNFDRTKGETISGLAIIPGNFWERVREDLITLLPELSERNLASNVGAAKKYRCFLLVSSIITPKPDNDNAGDERGRLMFLACPLNPGESLVLLQRVSFSDSVLAVEFSSYTAGQHKSIAAVSTGRRVVIYDVHLDSFMGNYLEFNKSISINSPAKALHISPAAYDSDGLGKYICAASEEGEVNLRFKYIAGLPGVALSTIELENFPTEVFDCIDARQERRFRFGGPVSLDSSGIIRSHCSNKYHESFQGHIGDARPLSLVQRVGEWSTTIEQRLLLVVTRGGGVVELQQQSSYAQERNFLKLLDRGLLMALQRAIVEHRKFKFDKAAVEKFLCIDRKRDIFVHQKPLGSELEGDKGPERTAATAEGPAPAAISAEPALAEFLSSVEEFNRKNRDIADLKTREQPREMVHLSVLRLFLDSPVDTQRELLLTAIKNVGGGEDVGEIDIDAVVYELAQIGAHSMF